MSSKSDKKEGKQQVNETRPSPTKERVLGVEGSESSKQ